MTRERGQQLEPGLYRLFWKQSGTSLAAVYQDREGVVWFVPTNWVSGPSRQWRLIEKVERLRSVTSEEPIS